MVQYNDPSQAAESGTAVFYLCGPMINCKSEPNMEAADFNQGAFFKLSGWFIGNGCGVVNPASFEHISHINPDDENFAQRLFLKNLDLLTNRASGGEVTEIVFLPPAHSLESTSEQPDLKDWSMCPECATLAAMALSLQLEVEFSQASVQPDGSYKLEPVSAEDIKASISTVIKELQKDYGIEERQKAAAVLEMPSETTSSVRIKTAR